MRIEFDRLGSGEPLLLVHGTGSARTAWAPVLDQLAEQRELFVVDLPGHGRSPSPPGHLAQSPPGYAHALAGLLDELDLEMAHVSGFSVGGWTALELAKLGRARSVVALSPAGLWERYDPLQCVGSLWLSHRLSRRLRRFAPRLLGSPIGRTLALGQNFGRPWRVPPEAAVDTIETFAATAEFDLHLATTRYQRFEAGQAISAPVTVAFGTRDHLIPRRARRRDELPAHTRWLEPEGCGHVPFWDDPDLIAGIILEGTAPTQERAATTA